MSLIRKLLVIGFFYAVFDLNDNLMSNHSHRGFISVVTQQVTDTRQAPVSPLGLYVTNLTWGEAVSMRPDKMGPDQQSTNTESGNAQKPNGGQNPRSAVCPPAARICRT